VVVLHEVSVVPVSDFSAHLPCIRSVPIEVAPKYKSLQTTVTKKSNHAENDNQH